MSLRAFLVSAKADEDVHVAVVEGLKAQLAQSQEVCRALRVPPAQLEREARAHAALAADASELRANASAMKRSEESAHAAQQQLAAVNAFLRKRIAAADAAQGSAAQQLVAASRKLARAEAEAQRTAVEVAALRAELRATSAKLKAAEDRALVEERAATLFEQRRSENERTERDREQRAARLAAVAAEGHSIAAAQASARGAASRAEADIGVANAACEELDELRRTFAALENF